MNKEAIAFGGYIKELEAELQEAYDDIHLWKSRFYEVSNQADIFYERIKKAIEYLNQPYRDDFDFSRAELIRILEGDKNDGKQTN